MENMKEKYALVTGGSNGIGYELAKLFAKDGYNLILVARTPKKLQDAARNLSRMFKVNVETIQKDLFEPGAAQEVYNEVKERGFIVEALVNNAGQGEFGFFSETTLERDLDIINLDIVAPVVLTKLFAADMVARGKGYILNLASVVSKTPSPLLNIYSASKHFMYAFSMMLHNEMKDKGVKVTALLPGSTQTNFFNKAGMLNTKEYKEKELASAADVAMCGFDALMAGRSHVIHGAKNRMMVTMGRFQADDRKIAKMRKMQKNIDGTEGKAGASISEGDKKAAGQAVGTGIPTEHTMRQRNGSSRQGNTQNTEGQTREQGNNRKENGLRSDGRSDNNTRGTKERNNRNAAGEVNPTPESAANSQQPQESNANVAE